MILGILLKNSNASSTVISSTSAIVFPLYFTSNVSLLYLLPLQTSHGTYISAKKCISIFSTPSPLQASHLPPCTLKLNLPLSYPLIFASLVPAKISRIISNTPVYVAGFERGVLPIGDWSIFIILSIFSIPLISSHFPGFSVAPLISLASDLYKTSFTRVLFPEPETPVTQTNCPSGNFTFTFFKLFSVAPFTSIALPLDFLLFFGTCICFLPLKYCPVTESVTSFTSSAVPWAITLPPCTPAPGPISIIWSAAYIVSSSCSTTNTVFPWSLNFFKVSISFSLSLWCKPILGSSKIYSTPVNPEPICVASLIRWASPPDNVPALLDNVKYSRPTSIKNCNLLFNSLNIWSAIILSFLLSSNELI